MSVKNSYPLRFHTFDSGVNHVSVKNSYPLRVVVFYEVSRDILLFRKAGPEKQPSRQVSGVTRNTRGSGEINLGRKGDFTS